MPLVVTIINSTITNFITNIAIASITTIEGSQTENVVAFGRECPGFEFSYHRPTSSLGSLLPVAAAFLRMMYIVISSKGSKR